MERPKQEDRCKRTMICTKDVDKLKKTLKIGDKLYYRTVIRENGENAVSKDEKVFVIKKFPHLVLVGNPKKPEKGMKTMTYKEILFQRKGLIWLNFKKE